MIKQIQTIVSDLNTITNYAKKENLVTEVVDKLDLFTALAEIKDKKLAEKQVTALSSYLLFNQLLFYRIYQKKMESRKGNSPLLELDKITKLEDIQVYFDAITDIDFKSIYRPNILGHIQENKQIIDVLNQAIQAIKLLRAEHITHDLAGRFFHDLIPYEVRKILAAYYTHPNSADLLAGLTIRSWDNAIIDPACGSGTLLVSSYVAKFNLYKETHGYENLKSIHKQFLENDITGLDIMPFASHLSTINLAMQNIEQDTNIVRIASMDSLELAPNLKKTSFVKGKGIEVTGFEKSMQITLTNQVAWSKKRGSVSMDGAGSTFYLRPLDVVIMNPPFSDREKMPKDMRDKLIENSTLRDIAGGNVNLWGYFIALADLLLKKDGKLGAVIPINVARGRATENIRKHLLNNYSCQFIIIPIEDNAFSEGASFKDVLYIAEKRKPRTQDYTAIVTIKVSLKNMKNEEVQGIVNELKECYLSFKEKQGQLFDIRFVKTKELLDYAHNMMPLIGFKTWENSEILDDFLTSVRRKAKGKLIKIDRNIVREGFHASPAGLSELVFITKPTDKSRTEKAFLILRKKDSKSLGVEIKNSSITLNVPISKTKPALRTLTAVSRFNVQDVDYVLFQEPRGFNKVLQLSKWKGDFDWFLQSRNVTDKSSYVVVGRRFRPNSVNTHHFAFCSKKKVVAPDTFKMLDFNTTDEALVQTLILNSSITMANILLFREQTTGGFTDIRESELTSFDVFDFSKLNASEIRELKKASEAFGKKRFPSIGEQYMTSNELRRKLDTVILKSLNFEKDEIDSVLSGVYKAIADELNRKD